MRFFTVLLLLAAAAPHARAQLTFEFSYGPGMVALFGSAPATATAIGAGMTSAGAKWSAGLFDPITVKLMVDLDAGLPSSVFAAATAVKMSATYTSVKTALFADSHSPTDATATASLQPGPKIEALTHDTSTTTVPSPEIRLGGATTGLWNSTLTVTRPNLKALGLLGATDGAAGADGTITINPAKIPAFDFTRGDGIGPGLFDFTGIMIHEIGHSMGFFSGVDDVDYAGDGAPDNPHDLSGTAIFTVLDLYRYHAESITAPSQPTTGAVNDWRFGPAPATFEPKPYFSIDEGATIIAAFSTGAEHGDGSQASHFSAGVGAILNPGFGPGIMADPTVIDITAMDAIGWDTVPTPEPTSAALLLGGLLVVAGRRRRC